MSGQPQDNPKDQNETIVQPQEGEKRLESGDSTPKLQPKAEMKKNTQNTPPKTIKEPQTTDILPKKPIDDGLEILDQIEEKKPTQEKKVKEIDLTKQYAVPVLEYLHNWNSSLSDSYAKPLIEKINQNLNENGVKNVGDLKKYKDEVMLINHMNNAVIGTFIFEELKKIPSLNQQGNFL